MDAFEIVSAERYDPSNNTPPTYPPLPSFAEALGVPINPRFRKHRLYFYGFGLTSNFRLTVRYTVRLWRNGRQVANFTQYQLTDRNQDGFFSSYVDTWLTGGATVSDTVVLFPSPRQYFNNIPDPAGWQQEPASATLHPFHVDGEFDRATVSIDKIFQLISYRVWLGIRSE